MATYMSSGRVCCCLWKPMAARRPLSAPHCGCDVSTCFGGAHSNASAKRVLAHSVPVGFHEPHEGWRLWFPDLFQVWVPNHWQVSGRTNNWQVSGVFLCVAEDMPTQKGDKMFAEGTFNKVRQDRGQGAITNPHSKEGPGKRPGQAGGLHGNERGERKRPSLSFLC